MEDETEAPGTIYRSHPKTDKDSDFCPVLPSLANALQTVFFKRKIPISEQKEGTRLGPDWSGSLFQSDVLRCLRTTAKAPCVSSPSAMADLGSLMLQPPKRATPPAQGTRTSWGQAKGQSQLTSTKLGTQQYLLLAEKCVHQQDSGLPSLSQGRQDQLLLAEQLKSFLLGEISQQASCTAWARLQFYLKDLI